MSVVTLTAENFDQEVLQATVPVVVDFYADWCGPCKMLAPTVTDIATMFSGKAKVCKLNIDAAQDIATQYGVMSIPTLIFFKNGKKVEQTVGALPKAKLADILNKYV